MYNMVFCVVGDVEPQKLELPQCDVAVAGFYGLGTVDYEKELRGITDKFGEAANLSKKYRCGLVCGCKTISRGLMRKSAAVADRGKLLGICDMNHVMDGEQYKSGVGLGFFKVNGCKVGVCIENDLLFADTFSALALCGCNAIVALCEQAESPLPAIVIRAYAYLYGIPIVMCAGKTAYFADVTGEIACCNQPISLFEISSESRYHIVTTRTRGTFAETRRDY